jgi:putative ABC transport system ATP-binding protein
MAAIEAVNLTRVFRVGDEEVRALDGLTVSLDEGSLAAIVGPSGSGKSTLMALLGGLDTPSSGSVSVYGQELNIMDPVDLATYRQSTVGFVFQDFFLLSHLTAIENVEVPLKLCQINRQQRRERARELIEMVGLGHRGDHQPQQLSGGERQRVAIARALANQPKLLLADEPTGNLDEKTGAAVTEILLKLNKDRDITVMLVTHNPELAEQTEIQFRLGGGKLISRQLN